jgi:DsbC/DsbD-like thiol-disulfide interchange protein
MTIRRFHTILLAALATTAAMSGPALAAVGAWSEGDRARVRLLAGGLDADGLLTGAIEIELAPEWHTYWRSPGAAGIPPNADFSTSNNVRDITIRYPVPHRYDDGYAVSNVYTGHVLLPLVIDSGDDADPVGLRLSLDIGVCHDVCIPEHFDVAVEIPPGATDATAARAISQAWSLIPGPPEPGVLAVEGIVREGGTDLRPEYAVTIANSSGEPAEVFVEGPADWYAGVPEPAQDGEKAVYRVVFDRLGAKTPIDQARFVVTIATLDRAIEQTIGLD